MIEPMHFLECPHATIWTSIASTKWPTRPLQYSNRSHNASVGTVEATTSVRQAKATAQRRMIDRAKLRFGSCRIGSWRTRPMVQPRTWLAEEKGIEPHIWCSINPAAPMAASNAATSPMTMTMTATSVRVATALRRSLLAGGLFGLCHTPARDRQREIPCKRLPRQALRGW